jgi:hypothetical protein
MGRASTHFSPVTGTSEAAISSRGIVIFSGMQTLASEYRGRPSSGGRFGGRNAVIAGV